MPHLPAWIDAAATGIETLAVVLMVGSIAVFTVRWLLGSVAGAGKAFKQYRMNLGRAMLVGLELLVAADIIRTVALDMTLRNILTLAALVVVRTFLGWTLAVEIEGCWPWQKPHVEGGPRLTPKEDSGTDE